MQNDIALMILLIFFIDESNAHAISHATKLETLLTFSSSYLLIAMSQLNVYILYISQLWHDSLIFLLQTCSIMHVFR